MDKVNPSSSDKSSKRAKRVFWGVFSVLCAVVVAMTIVSGDVIVLLSFLAGLTLPFRFSSTLKALEEDYKPDAEQSPIWWRYLGACLLTPAFMFPFLYILVFFQGRGFKSDVVAWSFFIGAIILVLISFLLDPFLAKRYKKKTHRTEADDNASGEAL